MPVMSCLNNAQINGELGLAQTADSIRSRDP